MMKTSIVKALALLPLLTVMSACSVMGTDYRMVYDNTEVNISGLNKGTACLEKGSFSGWVGDATIGAAAKAGGISYVKYVEHVSIGGNTSCVNVYGK
ncbi:MAG: TRL-like family protein [Gammaproteobacteria bacterium]|nr:TRL-like family protein [Gammaproteobacteria bacterium]